MKWIQQWVATAPSPTHPERNEDNFWVGRSRQAAAVIDGMGGYRRNTPQGEIGGEHASTLAAQVLADYLDNWSADTSREESKPMLRAALEAVNRAIWQNLNRGGAIPPAENRDKKPLEELTVGVALTVVALCDGGARAVMAQHGDTHGYILNRFDLMQVTEDQDLLLWERMNGLVTEADAAEIGEAIDNFDGVTLESIPDQRVMRYFYDKNIFGALGVEGNCAETGWSIIKLQPDDRFVLLSDGAYSNMTRGEVKGLAALDTNPATAVVELAIQRAFLPRFPLPSQPNAAYNMRSTQDDMTAVILTVGEGEATSELLVANLPLPAPEPVTAAPVVETKPILSTPSPTADTDTLPLPPVDAVSGTLGDPPPAPAPGDENPADYEIQPADQIEAIVDQWDERDDPSA